MNDALYAIGEVEGLPFASVREFLESAGGRLGEFGARTAQLAPSAVAPAGTMADLQLGPPVPNPAKVLCVGLNYADHVGETGRKLPEHPDIFAKFASSLIGPFDAIDCSDVSDNVDFEGELAVVIGRRCHHASVSDALSYVAGVTVLNDVTARDLQYRGTQWLPGKAVDRSTPCGPALVTLDELGDLQSLNLATRVNGLPMQGSNTHNMIFPVARIIAYISHFLELAPGDIIATGTPEGIGAKRQPPQWLHAGDVVEVEVSGVGTLRNIVK
ncbi:fumarylacetoacetate hydrolase family protein [Mycolicibacterium sp. P9-64]|uniref:fumarylacetoacetate hydrolase family protein n=1 Tax=Mycolicibacterium sp. P9-64 TaxID=2024612 RepID=UPI0018D65B92|nr:fumarylacetoacetate hydrolase family protein [Mycolicibacterium sp. P9-64]